MIDQLRDKPKSQPRLIIVSLCAAIFSLTLGSSHAQAGPLLDWLFQRNRSQGYATGRAGNAYGSPGQANAGYGQPYNSNARPYTSNYALQGQQAYGYQRGIAGGYGANTGQTANVNQSYYRGQTGGLFSKCGLFGRGSLFGNRNAGAAGLSANGSQLGRNQASSQLAGNQANMQYGQTAAYGGNGGSCPIGCQKGWCQQTVLRYQPQIAYRTDYQPVPVTTYKTSTTINPANGLPRTCTRPCTSYTWQARRVPYTTYRPIYTTVPVADDCGCNPNGGNAGGFGATNFNTYGANPNLTNPNLSNPNAANVPPQLPPSSGWQPVAPSTGPTYAPPGQVQANRVETNRLLQPIPNSANGGWAASGECAACQNHSHGFQGFSAPQSNVWSSQPTDNTPRVTPWQQVEPSSATTSGFRGDTPLPSAWRRVERDHYEQREERTGFDNSNDNNPWSQKRSSGAYGSTGPGRNHGGNGDSGYDVPWQRVPTYENSAAPGSTDSTIGGDEASRPPQLDPSFSGYRGVVTDDYYSVRPPTNRPRTRLVPLPKGFRPANQVIPQTPIPQSVVPQSVVPQSVIPQSAMPQSATPLYNDDPATLGSGERVRANYGNSNAVPSHFPGGYESSEPFGEATASEAQSQEQRVFGTPGMPATSGVYLSPDDNSETRRETGYRTKAIHDNMRGGPLPQDKTAREDVSPTSGSRADATRLTSRGGTKLQNN